MLAYAAYAPRHAERRSSPNAMLAIVAVHIAALAAVMSAKMDLPARILERPIDLILVPTAKPPPPPVTQPQQQRQSAMTQPRQEIPLPPAGAQLTEAAPSLPNFGELMGPSTEPVRRI